MADRSNIDYRGTAKGDAPNAARFVRSAIAEQIGVVRLQDDATSATRGLIQATAETSRAAEKIAAYGERQYVDELQITQRAKYAELSAKYKLDPEGFKAAWEGHSEGTLANVPSPWQRSARTVLGDFGSRGFAAIMGNKAENDLRNSKASWSAERANKEDDYLAAAARIMTGKGTPDEVARAHANYATHIEDGRRIGFIDERMAKLYREQAAVKADLESRGELARQRIRGIYDSPAPTGPARTTKGDHFGYANNNPGNVMVPAGKFEEFKRAYPGTVGQDARGFAKFATPEAGLAAMATVIKGYGENTLLGIVSRYAPKGHGDNDPEAYAQALGTALGVSPVEKVDPNDPAFMARLLPAMIKIETGQAPKYAPETYREAATPGARGRMAAREEIERFREEVRTNPKLRTLYPDVTFASVETGIRRAAAEMEAERAQARAENNEDFSLYITRLSRGLDVDVGEAQRRSVEAQRLGDGRSAKRWSMVATKGAALAEFGRLPLAQQAAELEAAYERAQKDTRDETALFEYDIKQQTHARALTAYKQDSFTYAHRSQRDLDAIPDVDWSKLDVAALRKIGAMVPVLEASIGAKVDPLPTEMRNRFASTWNAASAQDRNRIAAALNDGLGPALASRVFNSLSKDGNVDRATVFAAGIAERDPVLAREIYEGLDVLKTEKGAAKFKDESAQRAFNEYTGIAYKHSTEARDGAYEASRALMALWAKNNGKLGEEIPPEKANEIIKRVVGPTVRHNGSTLLPPRRDMDQSGFDTMLFNIRDQDAPKLKAMDGSEVSITRALRSGTLESYGDGRYVFRFGENYYLPDPTNPRRPFVLDRSFFESVAARIAAEDLGAVIGGESIPDRRVRPSKGTPLGIPVSPKHPFAEPKGGVKGER